MQIIHSISSEEIVVNVSPVLSGLMQRSVKRRFIAGSVALLSALPVFMPHSVVAFQPNESLKNRGGSSPWQSSVTNKQGWLIADRDDDDDDDRRHHRKKKVDLHRAKNFARQAAETANGGIQYYRAESSMHGPAELCPYVDNGDSWTFTFLGGRPGTSVQTIESVVTVYKRTARVVVAYNGPIRRVRNTTVYTFTNQQRIILTDLLRGNCECNYLLSRSQRTQIVRQTRSLPPGIQKQLLRGKGLPPGLAKRWIVLPKQVHSYINLPVQYDLVVVGSNVLLIDQERYVVIDMITNLFV